MHNWPFSFLLSPPSFSFKRQSEDDFSSAARHIILEARLSHSGWEHMFRHHKSPRRGKGDHSHFYLAPIWRLLQCLLLSCLHHSHIDKISIEYLSFSEMTVLMVTFLSHGAPGQGWLFLCGKNFNHIFITEEILGYSFNGHKVLILVGYPWFKPVAQFYFSKMQAKLSYVSCKANI